MRVPPELVGRRPLWHLPVAIAMLTVAILSAGIFANTDGNRAVATQSNRITKLQIVVARNAMEPDHLITAADLALDVRPIAGLPEGAITRPEELIGKTTHVPIRERTVLTEESLRTDDRHGAGTAAPSDTVPVPAAEPAVPMVPHAVSAPPAPEAPAVAVAVAVPEVPPAPSVPRHVAPAAPPEPSAPPAVAALRPLPPSGPALEIAPPIRPEPVPPSVAVHALPRPAVASAAGNTPRAVPRAQRGAPPTHRRFRSYVWVPGQPYSYAVGRDGTVQVIDPAGHGAPLDAYDDSEEADLPPTGVTDSVGGGAR